MMREKFLTRRLDLLFLFGIIVRCRIPGTQFGLMFSCAAAWGCGGRCHMRLRRFRFFRGSWGIFPNFCRAIRKISGSLGTRRNIWEHPGTYFRTFYTSISDEKHGCRRFWGGIKGVAYPGSRKGGGGEYCAVSEVADRGVEQGAAGFLRWGRSVSLVVLVLVLDALAAHRWVRLRERERERGTNGDGLRSKQGALRVGKYGSGEARGWMGSGGLLHYQPRTAAPGIPRRFSQTLRVLRNSRTEQQALCR